jgi:hypothetical protein
MSHTKFPHAPRRFSINPQKYTRIKELTIFTSLNLFGTGKSSEP